KGESAKCNVSVLRVTLSRSKLHIDCQHVIEWVSQPLPEGVYELSIEGKAITMRRSKDGWQVVQVSELLSAAPVRKHRKMSTAARMRIADGQRKRWAALKKAAVNK